MTTAQPPFPSLAYSVDRFCSAATEALDNIAVARTALDRLETAVRAGDPPQFEVESAMSAMDRLTRCTRQMATWDAHERGRAAQEQADVNGFMAEFDKLMSDGSLATFNARAIASMTPRDVVDALLARVSERAPDAGGWTMDDFRKAVAARVAQARPVPDPATAPAS